MAKLEAASTAYLAQTMRVLSNWGCLLVSGDLGKANVMTIGWGLAGTLWGRTFFIVAVRPSRYTYMFIEKNGDFTVNVPSRDMEKIVDYCGSVSGRDHDKFKESGLTIVSSKKVTSPIIYECVVHFECKVEYATDVEPRGLPTDVITECYPHGDYHRLYFGEVLATYADEDAAEHLPT